MQRKHIPASIVLLMGIPSLAQNPGHAHLAGAPVRKTVAPGRMTAISVNSLPNAVCTLRAQDDGGAVHTLRLYADDRGEVRFHVRPSAETDNAPNLQLSCEAMDQVMEHGVELRAYAAAAASTRRVRQKGSVRPALTGDPMLPAQEELLSRGYPMRPDPDQMPDAYANWLRVVTSEATEIKPRVVTRPGFHGGPTLIRPVSPSTMNSNNWSGFALYRDPNLVDRNPPPPYASVSAEWYVPSVVGEAGVQDRSLLWVGLDDLTGGDVLQVGTGQDAMGVSVLGIQWTVASFYGWTEFFPQDLQELTNFNLEPGDHMMGQVIMGNVGPVGAEEGALGVCYLFNLTTNTSVWIYILPPAGTTFTGSSAEWIMERPTINGVLTDLSDYSAATMFNAWAQRADGTEVASSGNSDSVQITMTDTLGVIMSTVKPVSNSSMAFYWIAFR